MRALGILVLAAWIGSTARAQEFATVPSCELRPRTAVTEVNGLAYAGIGSGELRRFDYARPMDRAARPAVILIHGGGWAAGSRDLTHRAMRTFAARGYVAVSIGYRLSRSPRDRFPAAVSDVRCAVRYLRNHAERYGVDPERIAAVGFSAGGHLAAMLALASDVPGLDDGSCPHGGDARIAGAVAWYAPLDLRHAERPRWLLVLTDFLGESPYDAPERAALASPITHVTRGDAPLVLVHGTTDPIVRIDDARAMSAALRGAHVPTHLYEVPDGPHGFPFGIPRFEAAACTTVDAVDRLLRRP
jgi:acetyl esterase/lipase